MDHGGWSGAGRANKCFTFKLAQQQDAIAGDATARIEVLEKQKAATDAQNRELTHEKRQLEAQALRSKVCSALMPPDVSPNGGG